MPGKYQLDHLNFTNEVLFSLVHNNKAILPSKRGKVRPRINEDISYDSPNSSVLSLDLSIDESCSRPRKLANIMMFDLMVTATGLCMTQNVLTVHFVRLRHISCSKCEKGLWLNENQNCFKDCHTQK